MNRKTLLSSLFWALIAGGVVAVFNGRSEAVSLRIWLGAFAVWLAAATLKHFLRDVPLPHARLQPLIKQQHSEPETEDRLRELRSLGALLLRSCSNERVLVQQLRPRLIALADHFLSVNHGVDRALHPERVDELFGSVAWLLDTEITDRKPTLAELNTFADVLIPDHASA